MTLIHTPQIYLIQDFYTNVGQALIRNQRCPLILGNTPVKLSIKRLSVLTVISDVITL